MVDPPIEVVLLKYVEVFEEPKGLLPKRSKDYLINLVEGTLLICVRPNRYLFYQKSEIEFFFP